MKYLVEFTSTIEVDADDEESAINLAQKEIAPNGKADIENFTTYVEEN